MDSYEGIKVGDKLLLRLPAEFYIQMPDGTKRVARADEREVGKPLHGGKWVEELPERQAKAQVIEVTDNGLWVKDESRGVDIHIHGAAGLRRLSQTS